VSGKIASTFRSSRTRDAFAYAWDGRAPRKGQSEITGDVRYLQA